jgi:hypothetical protein
LGRSNDLLLMNIYYNPNECGLEIVDVLDEDNLSYEFNTLAIFRATETGKLYWAGSSGCSCPTPFEEYHYASADDHDLNEIRKDTLDTFIMAVDNFPASLDERNNAIRAVRNHLKSQ